MVKLNSLDVRVLDKVLEMESGYVLDFTNQTFSEFFADEVGVNIDDPMYSEQGNSKGKRMRRFLYHSEAALAARALRKLWDYREGVRSHQGREETVPNAKQNLFRIIDRLEGEGSLAKTDAIDRFTPDETLDQLVAAIERDIAAGKPQVALDRLHTYCMKKFAHLLSQRGEQPQPGDTLNARAGRYFNPLRRTGRVRPISEKIMKSTVETFELYNTVRNTESLAHDTVLVEENEARFIFEAIANLLRFVKTIEGKNYGE